MDSRNEHVEALFEAALALSSSEERSAYLDRACAGDMDPALPIRGQDSWEMWHDGEALSIATENAQTGAQCLRIDGFPKS
jgi:hypothetical protein